MNPRQIRFLFTLLIICASLGCATKVANAECEKTLSLSFDEFDQTDGGGFRLLLDQKRRLKAKTD
jgi:hypothetical protein